MPEQISQTPEEDLTLDDLLLELFTPDFLDSLPPEHIAEILENLQLVEAAEDPVPPEWVALRKALQERGYLE